MKGEPPAIARERESERKIAAACIRSSSPLFTKRLTESVGRANTRSKATTSSTARPNAGSARRPGSIRSPSPDGLDARAGSSTNRSWRALVRPTCRRFGDGGIACLQILKTRAYIQYEIVTGPLGEIRRGLSHTPAPAARRAIDAPDPTRPVGSAAAGGRRRVGVTFGRRSSSGADGRQNHSFPRGPGPPVSLWLDQILPAALHQLEQGGCLPCACRID